MLTRVPMFVLLGVALAAPGFAKAPDIRPQSPLDGTLVQHVGAGPFLLVKGHEYRLSTVRTWHFNTLLDKRLAGRELRVEGDWAPDGTFKVRQFYTVKDGKLFRVRYFCKVCNIEALEPGNCVCCQAPTELQEVPVTP